MIELQGSLTPFLNFPNYLTFEGKVLFENSLKSYKADILAKRECKASGLNQNEIDLEIEKEKESIQHNAYQYDLMSGPVSFCHLDYSIKIVDLSLEYLSSNEICIDEKLYVAASQGMIFPEEFEVIVPQETDNNSLEDYDATQSFLTGQYNDIEDYFEEYADQDHETANNDELDNKASIGVLRGKEEAANFFCSSHALSEVFLMFRLSQLDVLSPVEKLIMLHDRKSAASLEINYNSDFSMSSVNENGIPEDEDHYCDRPLVEMLPDMAKCFVKLHHDFKNNKNEDAYSLIKAQRVEQAFENLQLVLRASFEEDFNLDNLNDEMDRGLCQKSLHLKTYTDYYEDQKDKVRDVFTLFEPEEWEKSEKNFIGYTDFSSIIYTNQMNEDSRQGFDNVLGKLLTEASQEIGLPEVKPQEIRGSFGRYNQLFV